MRIQIEKDDATQWVKPDRVERFLEQGWQLVAEPAPKKVSNQVIADVVVNVNADVIEGNDPDWDDQWEAPLVSMPSESVFDKPKASKKMPTDTQ